MVREGKVRTGVMLDEDLYLIVKKLPKKLTATYLINRGLRHYLQYIVDHPEYKEPDLSSEDWKIFVDIVKNVKNNMKKPHQPAP